MIRRKSKRPGADANQVAPANPVSATGAPPPGSIPPGGDQATSAVIDELMAAFSEDGASGPAATTPPPPPIDLGSSDVAELLAPEEREAAPSTRAMSPTEIVAQIEIAPPPEPAPPQDLEPEPTRRSTRRSRKEARREAKREKKRLAEHEKAQKKALKQTRRARRQARRQGDVQGSSLTGGDVDSDVRIITTDDPSVPPVIPSPPAVDHRSPVPAPDGPAGSTVRIAGDDLPDAVYVEGDLGGAGTGRSTVFIDEDPRTRTSCRSTWRHRRPGWSRASASAASRSSGRSGGAG